jgi:hypothetical protein
MAHNSYHIYGLVGIALGLYSVFKRKIGIGNGVSPRPQFFIVGLPAVLLGIAVIGIGVCLMLSAA